MFNAKLKGGVKEALSHPDKALQDYIADNTQDGKVQFYANLWHTEKNEKIADVTSGFVPAKTNDFYVFSAIPFCIWIKKSSTQPVKGDINKDATNHQMCNCNDAQGDTKAQTRIVVSWETVISCFKGIQKKIRVTLTRCSGGNTESYQSEWIQRE